ncbi:MAG TPA: sulfurtransferase complex subunit TusB [Burkholderiales bacterium]|jgi:tRNA 2-thiouridine synthesizing protein B|nr:sulfurtransferase complex subunit TusB [Burkholderiales bacterium]
MLHIVNKSPYEKTALASCLARATEGAAVLLIEDAVYGATRGNAAEQQLKQAIGRVDVYALGPDLEARGMKDRVIDGVKLVDYAGFVDLVAQHKTSQSWL